MKKIPVVISDFSKGAYFKPNPSAIPYGSVSDALNVVFDGAAGVERRDGYLLWMNSDITGKPLRTIFQFDRASGTRLVLAGVRNTGASTNEVYQIAEDGTPGGAAITGGTGYTTTYEMEFATYLDNAYMVNGVETARRYDGTSMVAAGVDGAGAGGSGVASAPAAPTSALAAGGSIPAGTYQHSVSFVYGARGESFAGTEGTARTTAAPNQQIDLSVIPTGPSGTTARRIYRRNTASTTNPRVFVGELADNTTTTYSDTESNADYSRKARTASAIPPITRYIAAHNHRMLYFYQTGETAMFAWSELATPDIVLSGSIDYVRRHDGGQLTGGASFRDRFIFLKDRGVYVLEGYGPNDWNLRQLDARIGCTHNRTIQVTPLGVIFAGMEGVWLCDGVSLKFLSDPIEPLYKNTVQTWTSQGYKQWTVLADFTQAAGGTGGGGTGGTSSGGTGPISIYGD